MLRPAAVVRYVVVVLAWQCCPQEASVDCRATVAQLHAAIDATPDKAEKLGTTSHAFKKDLVDFFYNSAANWTVLEVGRFEGDTTAVLSSLFARVISLDLEPAGVSEAVRRVGVRPLGAACRQGGREPPSNVLYLSVDVYSESWARFLTGNDVAVVMIDAVHSFDAVVADIRNALQYGAPSLRWIVLDDWGLPPLMMGEEFGVRRAAATFEAAGRLRCATTLGLPQGTLFRDKSGRPNFYLEAPEGKVCEVLRPLDGGPLDLVPRGSAYGPAAPSTAAWLALGNTTWWVFRCRWVGAHLSWQDARLHDHLVFRRLGPRGDGQVLSDRHGRGHYRPHLPLSNWEGRALVTLRFGARSFDAAGTRLQLAMMPREDGQAASVQCLGQPGRFDPRGLPDCRAEHYYLAMRDHGFTELLKRAIYDDRAQPPTQPPGS